MQEKPIYGFSLRSTLATRLIEASAARYAKTDAAFGVAKSFIPGGGIMKLISSMTMKAPAVFQPMVRDLAVIYGVSRMALSEPVIQADQRSAQAGAALAEAFDQPYLQGLAKDLAPDLGLGMAGRLLPGVGGMITALDTSFAATLTWRVGTMAVLFLLHGESWVGNKDDTEALAKQIVGKPQRQIEGRVRLQDLPYQVGQVYWKMVEQLVADIRTQRLADPALTVARARESLRAAGVRDDQIEAALSRS